MPRLIRSTGDEAVVRNTGIIEGLAAGEDEGSEVALIPRHDEVIETDRNAAEPVDIDPTERTPFRPSPDGLLAPALPLLDKAPIALAESMRYLVARFQMREDAKFPSRLGVTSALHGEGVTTISRTLSAIVAHDLERRVCWVDLTWPRRQETNSHAGIVDVLSGGTSLEDAIQVTGDVQLSILAPGRVPEGQGESFARSLAIGALLDELSDRFDCLIMDTPPVLAGSASLVQLRHASAYLLVVRQGVTSTQQIRAVTDELTSIPTMGVVLNAYKSRIPKRLSHFFVR